MPIGGYVHQKGCAVVADNGNVEVLEDGMDGFLLQGNANQLMQLGPFQGDTLPSRQFTSCGFVHGRGRTSGPLGNQRRCAG